MQLLIILTSFNTLILIGFVVLLGGALYFDYKKKAQQYGLKVNFKEFSKKEPKGFLYKNKNNKNKKG